MADYKELLRRAISALPENNGAARRAVYEKARSALVGQLRAISPPLPARDITQHRLQLEDCIRQVEQEASEAVISLGRDSMFGQRPPAATAPAPLPRPVAPPPAVVEPAPEPTAAVEPPRPIVADAKQGNIAKPDFFSRPSPALKPQPIEPAAASVMSIEDIISQAATLQGATVSVEPEKPGRPQAELDPVVAAPLIVAKAEASRNGPSSPVPGLTTGRPVDIGFKSDRVPLAATSRGGAFSGNTALAQRPEANVIAPVPVEAALSSVREVEVEPVASDAREAESVVASAIEALDREARGEAAPASTDSELVKADRGAFGIAAPESAAAEPAEAVGAAPVGERRSGTGLTIFLVVFAVLLAGAGGAGFWAWREGYVDLDQMFGQAPATTETAAIQTPIITTDVDTSVPGDTPVDQPDGATGPGNTATTVPVEPTTALEGLEDEERLVPTPQPDANGTQTALPSIDGEDKTEDRLPGQDSTIAANDPAASVDPAVLAGSQSLLLEASADGRTGAVPFSGTIAWREGEDELGQPTLIGTASIPARNLGVEVTIRKNSDPSLPASHLMEVDFQVSDSFIGGTIAGLPGVLLKNEELVPGTPLVGASARVVGNSFLFALSAAANDATSNTDLLESRRWMDLAVVYGTGRNAIITLEKDDDAQAMFERVFTAWQS